MSKLAILIVLIVAVLVGLWLGNYVANFYVQKKEMKEKESHDTDTAD